MREYFFHLAFELHPNDPRSPHITFRPPPHADIFAPDLPHHSTIPLSGSLSDTPQHDSPRQRGKSDPPSSSTRSLTAPSATPITGPLVALPSSRRPPTTHAATSSPARVTAEQHDWRFDRVSVVSIDMAPPGASGSGSGNNKDSNNAGGDGGSGSGEARPRTARGKSLSLDTEAPPAAAPAVPPPARRPSGLATKGRFIPTDPKSTELGWGVVHLYRDAEEAPGLYEDASAGPASDAVFDVDKCSTLCILAVPSYMGPADLLGFLGERSREEVSHFRLIRTGRANKYMVLMKFRDAKMARAWQKEWNGKPFNSMEPEYCQVVFVQSITFQTAEQLQQPSSFPLMTNDPFLPDSQPSTSSNAVAESPIATSLTTKPLAPPTPALIELPTCPVCLERMDETTGLLTILCQHVFHCACLERWKGTGCPVCRYTQNSAVGGLGGIGWRAGGGVPEDYPTECSVCGALENLWVCLICGNLGCGRYDGAHAFAHYEATRHSYAMGIATQHVWDYAGDGYVHRLIQNKADGKLLDLPAVGESDPGGRGGRGRRAGAADGGLLAVAGAADMVPRTKMEAMGNEYAYLLTGQLDSQRAYFEEQLERAVDKASKAATAAELAASARDTLARKLDEVQRAHEEALAQARALGRDVEREKARAEKSAGLAKTLGNDWKEEKTVNGALMERIAFLDAKAAEEAEARQKLEQEKRELEEQNRDLSFFISGTERLKDAGEEVVEGTVEVADAPEASGGKKRKGKKK